ncbi:hypothetical protein TRFO_35027 [Tritrichomonas foetus]|uniref:Serine/threonine-protein phosphatase n=1 Tax=Tritrichomonas foetus TaxID=1144522 RepID=A0A1J4JHG6_9EUKA|nr:hypothetical protein TRFO_35027 [Tritrichomonas foetus]|eukprot:OHS98592.1 hypothetical protein TRFO_35027 [Tritrichomonas foetus]
MYPFPKNYFAADIISSKFIKLVNNTDVDVSSIGKTVEMPSFHPSIISRLLHDIAASPACSNATQKPFITISKPVYVIGDLHGNIHDLIRIFRETGLPPAKNFSFLFLGDYVDKGSFSMEVVTFLLSLRYIYPDRVFLLRGNHEFPGPISQYTLRSDIEMQFCDVSLLDEFNYIFSWLPVAAMIDNEIFCVHGGISPKFQYVNELLSIHLPLPTWANPVVTDILWADPAEDEETSRRNAEIDNESFQDRVDRPGRSPAPRLGNAGGLNARTCGAPNHDNHNLDNIGKENQQNDNTTSDSISNTTSNSGNNHVNNSTDNPAINSVNPNNDDSCNFNPDGMRSENNKNTLLKRKFKSYGDIHIDDIDDADAVPQRKPYNGYDDEEAKGFRKSPRGQFFEYGESAVARFLEDNQIKIILRAHQMVDGGIRYHYHNRVVTIFSSSDYVNSDNIAGFLEITDDGTLIEHHFKPIEKITRQDCLFLEKPNICGPLNSSNFGPNYGYGYGRAGPHGPVASSSGVQPPYISQISMNNNDCLGKIIMQATANRRTSRPFANYNRKISPLLPTHDARRLSKMYSIAKPFHAPLASTMEHLPPVNTDIVKP